MLTCNGIVQFTIDAFVQNTSASVGSSISEYVGRWKLGMVLCTWYTVDRYKVCTKNGHFYLKLVLIRREIVQFVSEACPCQGEQIFCQKPLFSKNNREWQIIFPFIIDCSFFFSRKGERAMKQWTLNSPCKTKINTKIRTRSLLPFYFLWTGVLINHVYYFQISC